MRTISSSYPFKRTSNSNNFDMIRQVREQAAPLNRFPQGSNPGDQLSYLNISVNFGPNLKTKLVQDSQIHIGLIHGETEAENLVQLSIYRAESSDNFVNP